MPLLRSFHSIGSSSSSSFEIKSLPGAFKTTPASQQAGPNLTPARSDPSTIQETQIGAILASSGNRKCFARRANWRYLSAGSDFHFHRQQARRSIEFSGPEVARAPTFQSEPA